MIRVLALDHFSEQDRGALIEAGGADFAWRVIPYWRLRDAANRFFPPDVQEGLAAFAAPDLEPRRRAYAQWFHREVRRLYVEWPFDIFALPSDSFYYVRDLPEACHELGIPVVVLQKETTITEHALDLHSTDVAAHARFVSDRMTVCSERHKSFWVASGAASDRIAVTGQPRFDVYANPPAGLAWSTEGLPERRTVLFLSYEQDAYLLQDEDRALGWHELRGETEEALFSGLAAGWRVVIKLHPLQDYEREKQALERRAPSFGDDVVLAPPGADTRRLLLLADRVVGFQTTALYEAMLARKPVAYTAWGELHERLRDRLIPFDERPDLVAVMSGPSQLSEWLEERQSVDAAAQAKRLEFVEAMLGPVDGHASARTLEVLRAIDAEWGPRRASSHRRLRLARTVRPAAARTIASVAGRAVGLGALRLSTFVLPSAMATRVSNGVDFRLERDRDRLDTARRTLARR